MSTNIFKHSLNSGSVCHPVQPLAAGLPGTDGAVRRRQLGALDLGTPRTCQLIPEKKVLVRSFVFL